MNIYQQNGYANQEDYFNYLVMRYNVPLNLVHHYAKALYEEEHFDELISMLLYSKRKK